MADGSDAIAALLRQKQILDQLRQITGGGVDAAMSGGGLSMSQMQIPRGVDPTQTQGPGQISPNFPGVKQLDKAINKGVQGVSDAIFKPTPPDFDPSSITPGNPAPGAVPNIRDPNFNAIPGVYGPTPGLTVGPGGNVTATPNIPPDQRFPRLPGLGGS